MVGIGLRKEFAEEFAEGNYLEVDFIEIAPENWMNIGGYWKKVLDKIASQYPIFCHGLSLSIGSPDEIDVDFVKNVKAFLDRYNIEYYSEHISFSKLDNAHIYELLPVPFRNDAVKHISQRINQVQDILERPLILENISYYASIQPELSENQFIENIVKESGCKCLLDVNNVYVNGFNHQYSPEQFINKFPLESVSYIHIAGHHKVSDDFIIDTHGDPIINDVYNLLENTLQKIATPLPILLERDFNIPDAEELQLEINHIKSIVKNAYQLATYEKY